MFLSYLLENSLKTIPRNLFKCFLRIYNFDSSFMSFREELITAGGKNIL